MDIAYLKKLPAVLTTHMFNGTLGIALHDGHPLSGAPTGGVLKRYGTS